MMRSFPKARCVLPPAVLRPRPFICPFFATQAYSKNLEQTRQESFEKLNKMMEALTGKIEVNVNQSSVLMEKLKGLDKILEEEKLTWSRKVDDERREDAIRRTNEASAKVTQG